MRQKQDLPIAMASLVFPFHKVSIQCVCLKKLTIRHREYFSMLILCYFSSGISHKEANQQ